MFSVLGFIHIKNLYGEESCPFLLYVFQLCMILPKRFMSLHLQLAALVSVSKSEVVASFPTREE